MVYARGQRGVGTHNAVDCITPSHMRSVRLPNLVRPTFGAILGNNG